ncbi:hypothetical protein NMY22_g10159 [Coprinellus aureogranulatus]|nr:hypothetical protein NMY22_g10159 [Coprinellus aureogranulatus]
MPQAPPCRSKLCLCEAKAIHAQAGHTSWARYSQHQQKSEKGAVVVKLESNTVSFREENLKPRVLERIDSCQKYPTPVQTRRGIKKPLDGRAPPLTPPKRPDKPAPVSPDRLDELDYIVVRSPTTFSVVPSQALKRERPSNWRPDYLPPSTSWFKRSLTSLRALFTEHIQLYQRHALNPLLASPFPNHTTPFFDLRCNPFIFYPLCLPNGQGVMNHVHLLQLATQPALHEMLLWHPRLPWAIVVRSTRTNGVLVSDIMASIYSQLAIPIDSQDYYNQDMTAEDRERIEMAYKIRCSGHIGLLRRGILRVDFLGSDVGFASLKRSWNGMWEIRTVNIA